MSAPRLNRKLHRIGALLTFLPVAVIFGSGVLLQLKKEWSWVQPPTQRGVGGSPAVSLEEVLAAAQGVPDAGIATWEDVDRLDLRPERGVVKVRGKSRWEVQVDTATGEVLQVAYRRSDLVESLHDGSWFHDRAKLWVFLPTALVLCGLYGTGVYLWLLPYLVKRKRANNNARA
jgi:uncharacterized iron-regulated membrane protein